MSQLKRTRLAQAAIACVIFFGIAQMYALAAAIELHIPRVLAWSVFGIATYAFCSYLFGFDPYRRTLRNTADKLLAYIERWELRSGSATFVMLAAAVVAARMLDDSHFITAVVSATAGAWFYFLVRLLGGGYDSPAQAL